MQPNDARPQDARYAKSPQPALCHRPGTRRVLIPADNERDAFLRTYSASCLGLASPPSACHLPRHLGMRQEPLHIYTPATRRLPQRALQILDGHTHAKTLASSTVHDASTTHELLTVRPTNATHVCKLHEAQGIRTTPTLL
jgi:hypothetical protein